MNKVDKARERRHNRIANGLCPKCGSSDTPEHIYCARCRERERARQRRLREEVSLGLCVRCKCRPQEGAFKECARCRTRQRDYQQTVGKRRLDELQATVLAAYGNCCQCCGESHPKFLQLHHSNNDGAKHRKETGLRSGYSFFVWLIENEFPSDIELLCSNCHLGQHRNGGVCPHEEMKHEADRRRFHDIERAEGFFAQMLSSGEAA